MNRVQMNREYEATTARSYFRRAAVAMANAREWRARAVEYEEKGHAGTADAYRRVTAATVRIARTYHRSGLAAKRRAEQP